MKRFARLIIISVLSSAPAPAVAVDVSGMSADQCFEYLQKAGEVTGLVVGFYKKDMPWSLVVDENLWSQVPYDTKHGVAMTYDCALDRAYARFQIRGNLTNRVVGEWHFGAFSVP